MNADYCISTVLVDSILLTDDLAVINHDLSGTITTFNKSITLLVTAISPDSGEIYRWRPITSIHSIGRVKRPS